jgi:hypothetical protein
MKGQLRAWLNALIAVKEPEIWELTCAVCGDVRPDAKMISSRYVSKTVEAGPRWPEGEVFEFGRHITYCNDRPKCVEGSVYLANRWLRGPSAKARAKARREFQRDFPALSMSFFDKFDK